MSNVHSPAGFRTAMGLFVARLAGFHALIALGVFVALCVGLYSASPSAGFVVSLQSPTRAVTDWVSSAVQGQTLVLHGGQGASWRELRCTYPEDRLESRVDDAGARPAWVELELDCRITYANLGNAFGPESTDWLSELRRGGSYGLRTTKPVLWPEDVASFATYALLVHAVLGLGVVLAWRSDARRAVANWRDALRASISKGWLFVPMLAGGVIAVSLSSLGVSPGPSLPEMHGWPLAGFLIAALVAAPWVEEFFFRGWMVDSLRQCVPAWLAVLASANAFALMHVPNSVAVWGYYLVVGLSYSWLRSRSGSLVPGVLAHAVYNLVATTALMLPLAG